MSVLAAVGDASVHRYGPYLLFRKLAEGGMAEIFLAKQVGVEGFERNVVIKRMLPHLSGSTEFVAMFLDEARLAASLTHPNIVQIADLGLVDGCYFICMEYLAGEDLATMLRVARRTGNTIPVSIVLRVIAQAAVGLHFAHEAKNAKGQVLNLVHRDVSPSNIFVTYLGHVKVLDFGIAKAESRVTSTAAGTVKGKYQYMSPEQAVGDPLDRRGDVYSLGVTLYEALTGSRPFARDSDLAVLKAVLDGTVTPLRALRPDVSPEVEAIVARAMASKAEDRYPTALDMARDIDHFLGATTSATGGQMLGTYLEALVGPERVRSRTQVESLEELRTRVAPPQEAIATRVAPSQEVIATKVTEGASPATEQPRTKVVQTGSGLSSQSPSGSAPASRGPLLAVVGGALVVGGLLAALGLKRLTPAPPPPPVVLAAPPPVVPAVPVVVDAGLAPEDAGAPDAGSLDAGVPDAGVEVHPSRPVEPARPVSLTPALIQRSVSSVKGRLQQCFVQHRDELPAPQGVLLVRFAIAPTGRVSELSTDRPGTAISGCVEGIIRGLQFPRHVDAEVRVPLPLKWDVR
jgi:serine/threonine-protein kinase